MKNYLISAAMMISLAANSFAEDWHAIAQPPDLTLARDKNWLIIRGAHLPKGEIRINYLEAYCRTGSTTNGCAIIPLLLSSELWVLTND